MFKNMIFYTIFGSIIGFVAQVAGVSTVMTIVLSLVGPALILLVIGIIRFNKIGR
ncbi:MAG: hypothetical protein Q8O76_08840 [Chloroflexota bacterium]|nr:hypothetical protein [Chloroflexota bacterium]